MHRIITVSREFGSGGRTIGKNAAKKLGIKCYDEELITLAAKETGLAEDYIRENGEYSQGKNWFENLMQTRDYNGRSIVDDLWIIQSNTIKKIAEEEDCVIVGRCADYILRGKADLLTVFIHSAMDKRIERVVNVYGQTDKAPEKRLNEKDKKRRAYYQMYTDMRWGDVKNYQIALDSGILGLDKCTDLICELY